MTGSTAYGGTNGSVGNCVDVANSSSCHGVQASVGNLPQWFNYNSKDKGCLQSKPNMHALSDDFLSQGSPLSCIHYVICNHSSAASAIMRLLGSTHARDLLPYTTPYTLFTLKSLHTILCCLTWHLKVASRSVFCQRIIHCAMKLLIAVHRLSTWCDR
jgi:hypothetical protein